MTEINEEVQRIQAICSFTISALGIVGNTFAIYQIVSRGLYQQTCNVYILNLCINNLLTCLIVLPIFGINSFFKDWVMGSLFCHLFPYLMHTMTCIETSALMLITINRYVLVVHPIAYQNYYSSRRFNGMMLTFPVLFFLLLQLLPLTGAWGHFEHHPQKLYCTFSSDQNTRSYIVFLCSLILVTNVPPLIYCYIRILWTYISSKKRMSSNAKSDQSCRWIRSRQDLQLIRTVIVIIVCYGVTHIPFLVVNVVDSDFKQLGIVGYTLLTFLALSHTAINPVVYALLNTQINQNWKCCRMICSKRGEIRVHNAEPPSTPMQRDSNC